MEEHEIPGTSVKVVRVAGEDANAYGPRSGKAAARQKRQRYRTMEEKLKDIERYLIWQVESIRTWVIVAVGVSVISWAAVIALLLAVLNTPSGESLAGRGEGAVEPAPRPSARATQSGKVAETSGGPDPTGQADQPVVQSTRVAAKGGSAAEGEAKTRAVLAATDRAPARKEQAAGAQAGPKAKAAAATLGQKSRSKAADAGGKQVLAADSRAKEQQGAALQVAADSDVRAGAERAAAEKKPPPSRPPGRPLAAAGTSPVAVTGTTAPPVPSPPSEPAARKPAWSFRIGASAIASKMAGLVPKGTASLFSASQNRLYCWTRIESDSFSRVPKKLRYVVHRWIHKGETIRERKITIASPRYRAYSVLPNPGDRPGEWRVEIIDAKNRVIGTEKFVVE